MSATMYDGSEEPSAWGQLPPKIADALKDLDLQPTPAAIRLLRSASQLGEHKDSDHDVLSASGLLFTVVELARQRSERVTELNDSENEALQIVGRFFLGEQYQRAEVFDSVVMSNFYSTSSEFRYWQDTRPRSAMDFSDTMRSELAKLRGNRNLDVIDLIGASLASPGLLLQKRLARLGVDAEVLRTEIMDLKVRGSKAHYRRERVGPLALGARQYALALARLFRVADSEFSLALLAPWGMGKTTISREIQRYLSRPSDYAAELRRAMGSGADEVGNLAEYEIVTFSAWTYRRQPELWIWLYESFVKAFLSRGNFINALRIFRCGIAKHGFTPLYKSLLMMAFLAFPLTWIAAVVKGGVALFGVAGLLTVVLLGRRWFIPVRTLIDRYGVIANHRERLGLQALIGDDLRALVDAWVRGAGPQSTAILAFVGFLASVATLWAFMIPAGAMLLKNSEAQSVDCMRIFA